MIRRALNWLVGDFLLSPAACLVVGHNADPVGDWCVICHRRIA